MAFDEERTEQTFQEIEKETEKRKVSPLKFFPPKALFWVGIAIVGLFWLYSTQKMKFSTALGLFAFILLIIYLMGQKVEEAGYLTEKEAKDMLAIQLKHKQIFTDEIPDGKIVIDANTKEIWRDSGQGMKPWKRLIGFSVTDRNTELREYSVAEVNILKADRPGDIISIAECPGKFDGKTGRDIQMVFGPDVYKEKRYVDLMRRK
ncbi:hypothetical protein KKE60_07635 [Patescibacteria group bacterium]|nr:hypothetical protein [Patescibacteria group bacterium]